jgi:hypothetical protein
VPFSSRFQNSLNDLHREAPVVSQCRPAVGCRISVMILIVCVVFLADAAAQRPPIANMARQRVNAKVEQQQPPSPTQPQPAGSVDRCADEGRYARPGFAPIDF